MPRRTKMEKYPRFLLIMAWFIIIIGFSAVPLLGFLLGGHREITTRALARFAGVRVIPQEVQDELVRGSIDPDLTESGLFFTNSRYDARFHFDNDGDYS